jgi:hypothetical protein
VLEPGADRGKEASWRRELRLGKGFVLRDDLHVVAERGARLRWKPDLNPDRRRAERTDGGPDAQPPGRKVEAP